MLFIRVDNRVRVPAADLPPAVRDELCAEFSHDNPQHDREVAMGYRTDEPARYVTWTAEHGDLTFPRGGFRKVRQNLRRHGIAFHYTDDRAMGERDLGIPDSKVSLYGYQREAVEAMIARENCLLRAPTGSGKTTIALATIAALKLPTIVMVWSGNLLEQWEERLVKELGMRRADIGRIRGDDFDVQPITLAMQQSVYQRLQNVSFRERVEKRFAVFAFDEVQRAAADTMFGAIDPFHARYRFGFSADESRADGKEFLTYDLFGAVAADIPREQLIASGHVLDVTIDVHQTAFECSWYRFRPDFNALLKAMTNDEDRNAMIIELTEKELARGERVLILSHRVEHCRDLSSMLASRGTPNGLLLGGKGNEEEFRESVTRLKSGEWKVGIGTIQAVGQGLDIPSLSVGIVTTPLAGNRQQFGQVRGRVCRTAEGKSHARLHYLWDRSVYGMKAIRNLADWNDRVIVDGVDAKTMLKRKKSA